jgi:GntR family transcriptional regulator, vanillate catabolism transcriptional regulator
MEAPAHDAIDRSASSQTVRALLKLRDFILSGELKPGDRISELPLVERLGVSRTPIRMALVRLEEEGLLAALLSGGFAVKAFSERDIYDAIEIRGARSRGSPRGWQPNAGSPNRLLRRLRIVSSKSTRSLIVRG